MKASADASVHRTRGQQRGHAWILGGHFEKRARFTPVQLNVVVIYVHSVALGWPSIGLSLAQHQQQEHSRNADLASPDSPTDCARPEAVSS